MAYYSNPNYRKSQTINNKGNTPSVSSGEKRISHQVFLSEIEKSRGDNRTGIATNAKPIRSVLKQQPIPKQQPGIETIDLSLNKEELIKGIIFSEIIGKPKARRMGR